jgi:hypothetical protein
MQGVLLIDEHRVRKSDQLDYVPRAPHMQFTPLLVPTCVRVQHTCRSAVLPRGTTPRMQACLESFHSALPSPLHGTHLWQVLELQL